MNPDIANPEEYQATEQEKIDSAEPLSEEQLKEKEELLQKVRTGCDLILIKWKSLILKSVCKSVLIVVICLRDSLTGAGEISTSL